MVPLLVDHEETTVIVDSMRICEYLDGAVAGPLTLIPAGNAAVRQQAEVAYRSKIAKEQASKALAFDPQRQRGVRNIVQTLIDNLDVQLGEAPDPWVCGSEFSFADIE